MTTFISPRKFKVYDILIGVIPTILIISVVTISFLLIDPTRMQNFNWLIPLIFLLGAIIKETGRERFRTIVFDQTEQRIVITYNYIFSSAKEIIVPYSRVSFRIVGYPSKYKLWNDYHIWILRDDDEVFKLSADKDLLPNDMLEAIANSAKNDGIAIVRS